MSMYYDQQQYRIRCEWGEHGVATLAPVSDVVIVVDVLSFSTCVEIAVGRGATVRPWRWKDVAADQLAARAGIVIAGPRGAGGYSLSPASLLDIPSGTELVLPSPNGSTLSLSAADSGAAVLAGCFRNARAVADAALSLGETIAVIPAGERWPDGSLRPALEDWLCAGAIVAELEGDTSPEAAAAAVAFRTMKVDLLNHLTGCGSGRELVERGFEVDIRLAAEHAVSGCVPRLFEIGSAHQADLPAGRTFHYRRLQSE